MTKKIRIGALISGSGSNLQAIIDACEAGRIDGEIVFVGSDVPGVKGLERAKKHKIPNFVVDYEAIIKKLKDEDRTRTCFPCFSWKDIMAKSYHLIPASVRGAFFPEHTWMARRLWAEKALLDKINEFEIDLLVLAGFMRNLTSYFIDSFSPDPLHPRIMNIHPALLPSFKGIDGYGDTIRYGCKVGGCTVHFVDYGEDTGPIIGQRSIFVLPGDTTDSFRQRGLQEEYKLFPECIQLFATGALSVMQVEQRDELLRNVVKIEEIHRIEK